MNNKYFIIISLGTFLTLTGASTWGAAGNGAANRKLLKAAKSGNMTALTQALAEGASVNVVDEQTIPH